MNHFGALTTSPQPRQSLQLDRPAVVRLIQALHNYEIRGQALLILSEEIISLYRSLHSPNLERRLLNRARDALALLQCVSVHPQTKMQLMKASIHLYAYPILRYKNNGSPRDFLRITSLGVIGALMKVDDPEVVHFLLESTELFPSCLCCMEVGCVLSKTMATFIIQRILANGEGMLYCCSSADRFYAVVQVLDNMIEKLAENEGPRDHLHIRLLRHIIWCYYKFSEDPRVCSGLIQCFPHKLSDSSFINILYGDQDAMQCLHRIFNNLSSAQQYVQLPTQQYIQLPPQQYVQLPAQQYVQLSTQQYIQLPAQQYIQLLAQQYIQLPAQQYKKNRLSNTYNYQLNSTYNYRLNSSFDVESEVR